jgi:hypothetical protein
MSMGSTTLKRLRSAALGLPETEPAVDAALDLLEEEIVPLTAMPGAAGKRGAKRLILEQARRTSAEGKL